MSHIWKAVFLAIIFQFLNSSCCFVHIFAMLFFPSCVSGKVFDSWQDWALIHPGNLWSYQSRVVEKRHRELQGAACWDGSRSWASSWLSSSSPVLPHPIFVGPSDIVLVGHTHILQSCHPLCPFCHHEMFESLVTNLPRNCAFQMTHNFIGKEIVFRMILSG